MRADYFEGILQLRKPSRKLMDFVKDRMEKEGVHVAKWGKVRNGYDFYVSSNPFLRNLSFSLKKRFCGELKMTYTLHTRKNGKDLYRTTLMFKLAPFMEQDIIEFKGDRYKVVKVRQKVELKDTKTGKKKLVKFDDLEKGFRKITSEE
jgi:NMD protein affecting ribosome stability and mRNA decay